MAVSVITLYHFGIPGLDGGFVGVDVFFVISGFLITRGVLSELGEGSFRFTAFYARRIRRLFPAMLATLVATAAVALLVLSPAHLEQFGDSLRWSLASAANIHFFREVDYFDTSSVFKPLLHFWSLGVEEQFYLAWPLLIVAAARVADRTGIGATIAAIAAVSLTACVWMTRHDAPAAFYLAPFRAWEFALGGACALFPRPLSRTSMGDALCIAAATTLATVVTVYHEAMSFPGTAALVPVIATVVLIRYGGTSVLAPLLEADPVRWLGRISYSLYLVHWPLVTLWSYWRDTPTGALDQIALVVLALILSTGLHLGVEQRFRRPTRVAGHAAQSHRSGLRFAAGIVASGAGLLGISAVLLASDGLPVRIAHEAKRLALSTRYESCLRAKDSDRMGLHCSFGRPEAGVRVLLLGDSHAAHFVPAWEYLAERGAFALRIETHPGCPPLLGTGRLYNHDPGGRMERECFALNEHWRSLLESGEHDVVVLAARWASLTEDADYGTATLPREYLVDTHERVADLTEARRLVNERMRVTVDAVLDAGSRVVLMSQVPLLVRDVQDCDRVPFLGTDTERLARRCAPGVDRATALARLARIDALIGRMDGRPGVLGLRPSNVFCAEPSPCRTVDAGLSLYHDTSHLTPAGSLYYARAVETRVAEFMETVGSRTDDDLEGMFARE